MFLRIKQEVQANVSIQTLISNAKIKELINGIIHKRIILFEFH